MFIVMIEKAHRDNELSETRKPGRRRTSPPPEAEVTKITEDTARYGSARTA